VVAVVLSALPGTVTVTVLRRVKRVDDQGTPVRDSRGNAIYDDVSVDVPNCSVQPGTSLESDDQGRDAVSTYLTIYAPPDFPDSAINAVLLDGVRWEVSGQPQRWAHPRLGHVVINCVEAR
jgi:hypothetical protein